MMRIDRTLSFYTTQMTDRPHVSQTGIVQDEVPHLQMNHGVGEDGLLPFENAPTLITLRCQLIPHYISEKPTAVLTHSGKALIAAPLYLIGRPPVEALDIVFEGDGTFLEGEKVKTFCGRVLNTHSFVVMSTLLYKRSFECMKENLTVTQSIVKGQTITDPPGTPAQPFFAYGGAFHSGMRLSDVQQYYCTISSNSTHTLVTPHGARALMERGLRLDIATPQKLKGVSGDVQLMSPLTADHSHSLYDDLVKGSVKVKLIPRGSDDPKDALTYSSFQAEQLGLSSYINISFKRSST